MQSEIVWEEALMYLSSNESYKNSVVPNSRNKPDAVGV